MLKPLLEWDLEERWQQKQYLKVWFLTKTINPS